ncbi:MAG: tRNA pseudouridine(55) synthase TruB [Alphaproteobacteria bacterium]|nr:tRNA pseudouridine(55) synthase TruB [Alphaproteobacteria bacterium]
MARRVRGKSVHGWVVLDKPSGITSAQAVAKVRRVFDAAKAGHSGTLDPLATGVLPIALGEATKTVSYVMDASKDYAFTIHWGEARSTDDVEGAVIATSDVRPDRAAIERALPAFTGEIEQVPPRFSAVKIDGERAYDLARSGEAVDLEPRRIVIHDFALIEIVDADRARFRVVSGKGAYMRSLARDLAVALGTVGHIEALRRLRVGPFHQDDAISLDSLTELMHNPAALEHLRSVATALDGIPALALTGPEARTLRNGQGVPVYRSMDRERFGDLHEDDTVYATEDGVPVAIARIEAGAIRPIRVLNL